MGVVKTKRFEVIDALLGIGIDDDVLVKAVSEGEIARDSCTLNDPTCFPGIFAWGRTVRSLRDQLVVKGWTRNDDRNYPTVVSPDGTTAIAVATGDEWTGRPDKSPSTKYPKGSVTQSAVNQNQGVLFPEMRPKDEDLVAAARVTWYLLKRRTENMVAYELSLPDKITADGTINNWHTRILFNSITMDSDFTVQDDSSDEPIDVPVMRRVAN